MPIDLDQIKNLDVQDKISRFREEFLIHDSSLIYLDGNSLGRLPKQTIIDINNYMINEWGEQLVNGWENWINEAQESGDLLAKNILGAKKGEVLICDTTSINFYQLCSAVIKLNPDRKTIITDSANFPTDRYILEGIF